MAQISERRPVEQAWLRQGWAIAIALLVMAGTYYATFAEMIHIWWRSQTFNHAFLILPIALYLGWQKRAALARVMPENSLWGMAYTAANAGAWFIGRFMSVAALEHAAVVGLIIGIGWSLLGNRAFRLVLFPFLYLYFAVPFGEFLVPYLQQWTAVVVVWLLRLTGVPVYLEGLYLSIPSGNFVVAEACSGINYLIATLAVASMYMYLSFSSWQRRLVFMCVAIVVPLLANGIRAYGIVMIAHLSDYKYAMGVDHFIYGWVFFGVVIFCLFAIGHVFSDAAVDAPAAPAPALPSVDGSAARFPARQVLSLLAILVLPHALIGLIDMERELAPDLVLPTVSGWRGPYPETARLGTRFDGADSHLSATYVNAAGHEVVLGIVYFRTEREGAELINQTNRLFDKDRWKQLEVSFHAADADSVVQDFAQYVLRESSSGQPYLLWHWYDVRGQRTARSAEVKVAQALGRLFGDHPGAASVTIRTLDQDDAAQRLADFSTAPELALENVLGEPRGAEGADAE